MQRLWLQGKVFAEVPLRARRETQITVNSLDPRAKRFRAADKSLQQARLALQGAQIALADLPRSSHSPVTGALDAIGHALSAVSAAAEQIDEARLDDSEEMV